ncbi:MAG: epoxyqueuosine reductase QueH [bacterium]
MASLLLHICCGPCSLYPIKVLKDLKFQIKGFFYNPNIHPTMEYMKRRDTVKAYISQSELPVMFESYNPEEYFKNLSDYENRCFSCYELRLEKTASTAKRNGSDYFSTTLLYSIRQKHDMIKSIALEKERKYGVKFYYHDFREGWRWAIEESKQLGMYRQNYCGCIFSEKERFYKE